jgi:TRAP-type C4-dicarboxylate transport system substrate-binding protein
MAVMGLAGAARVCAVALILSAVASPGAADDKTFVMKISFPTLNDNVHEFAKSFAAAIEKDSAGRIKTEIYPASQLGSIQRQIEGVQFGAIQAALIPPEFFVGIDERFEVLAAPGLVKSMAEGQRLAADPAVLKLMLGLGADKGLHGAGLFMAAPSSVIARAPIRHLGDFKGKKIRIFASQFQSVAMRRLGATPKPMTLAEVLPALQDNALDGAVATLNVFVPMHYVTVAKYVTEIEQPAVFTIVEISRKWYDSLPADLQQTVDKDAALQTMAINPWSIDFYSKVRKAWTDGGGELISLPPDEQSAMLKILVSVGDEVANAKPLLGAAYKIVTDAAQRAR